MEKLTLADWMQDLGYGSCYNHSILRRILERTGVSSANAATTLKEPDVARAVALMVCTHSGLVANPGVVARSQELFLGVDASEALNLKSWDVQSFVKAIADLVRYILPNVADFKQKLTLTPF